MMDSNPENGGKRKRRFSDVEGGYETVIGPEVTITGEMHATCNVDLYGTVEGNLEIEGLLRLREGSRVVGDITATNAIIDGEVRGAVHAREKAELRSACRVDGDLVAESVAIADGGHFEGKITMAGTREARKDVSFEEKRADRD